MSAIDTYLGYIASKRYAKDVRTAIVNAIRECYSNTQNPSLREEAFIAAIEAELENGHLTGLDLGDGDVTTAKIANSAVTTPKIADGAITQAKLDPNIDFVQVDDTLTQKDEAADAKATGDALSALNISLGDCFAILMPMFKDAVYTTPDGLQKYKEIKSALNIDKETEWIKQYDTRNTVNSILVNCPSYLPNTLYRYDYTREITKIKANFATTGTLSVVKIDSSTLTLGTNANRNNYAIVQTFNIANTGVQELVFTNPVQLDIDEIIGIAIPSDSAVFKTGNFPTEDKGFWYWNSSGILTQSLLTSGIGVDIFYK